MSDRLSYSAPNSVWVLVMRATHQRGQIMQRKRPDLPSSDKRWKLVNATMRRNGYAEHALIEALHSVQDAFGYLDEEAMTFVADSLDLPLSKVYGVATFYHLFMLKPQGRHTCVVCTGTACYIKGAGHADRGHRSSASASPPGETTEDKALSVLTARCVGACGLAPAVVLDGNVIGKLGTEQAHLAHRRASRAGDRGMNLDDLEDLAEQIPRRDRRTSTPRCASAWPRAASPPAPSRCSTPCARPAKAAAWRQLQGQGRRLHGPVLAGPLVAVATPGRGSGESTIYRDVSPSTMPPRSWPASKARRSSGCAAPAISPSSPASRRSCWRTPASSTRTASRAMWPSAATRPWCRR
jgi:bidirectional [NiFe] hydrogenase diaphorase subunit